MTKNKVDRMKLIYAQIKKFFFIFFLVISSFKSTQSSDNWDSLICEESPFFLQILEIDELINHQGEDTTSSKRKISSSIKRNHHKNKKNKKRTEVFEIMDNNELYTKADIEPKEFVRNDLAIADKHLDININDYSSQFDNNALVPFSSSRSKDFVNNNVHIPIFMKENLPENRAIQNKNNSLKNKKKTYVKWNKNGLYNELKNCMDKLNITKATWRDDMATNVHKKLKEEKNQENVSWQLPSEVAIRDKVRRELGLK